MSMSIIDQEEIIPEDAIEEIADEASPSDSSIVESLPEELRKRKEEQEKTESEEPMRYPRQIVGIGFVSSIRSLLMEGTSDESSALEKIVNKCVDDFVLKCTKILEDCTEIPSTAYTYVVFMERFGWLQQEDSTTKPGTRNIIAQSKKDFIAKKILDLFAFKNKYLSSIEVEKTVFAKYFHSELLDKGKNEKNISVISNMFGKDLFPNLNIWYNYNEDIGKWQYVYSISAPEGSLKTEENKEKETEKEENE